MFTFRRLATVFPLLFLFSLLAIHAVAQPFDATRNTTIQVQSGAYHTCGVRANNTVECWGENIYGQLNVPPDLGTVKAVSAGAYHNCAIKSNDTVQCWGRQDSGQSTPPEDLGTVKAVGAGLAHTCVIKSDDTVQCWGDNLFFQSTPPEDLGMVKMLSVGFQHTCVIKSDDTVQCWGDNSFGQRVPTVDPGTVKAVNAGDAHTCVIKSDDTLQCWGANSYQQSTPPVDLGTVKVVSGGNIHTCAIKSDDTLSCWGFGGSGQTTIPPDLGTVSAVSAGTYHTCAISIDDSLRCWGRNNEGQTDVPQPTVSLQSPTIIVAEGAGATLKVNASDYLWTNAIITMRYTGTATRTSDYNAPFAALMTSADLSTDLLISVIDDSEIEPDETIVIDIASVTGGTENGTQQVTLVIQDNDELQTNLTVNSGFEDGQTGWTVKRGVGEKVKCNKEGKPPVAKSGTCAFQFKGGAGERSSVEQTLAAQTWAVGDTLNLSAFVKATNSAANGKIKVRVKYSDGTATGKIDANIVQNSDYVELTGEYTLLSANVSRVKLSIQNRSAAGKVWVDDVELLKGSGSLLALP